MQKGTIEAQLKDFRTREALLVALGSALAGVMKGNAPDSEEFVLVPQQDGGCKIEYLKRPEKPHRHKGAVVVHDLDSFCALANRYLDKSTAIIYAQLSPASLTCVLNDSLKKDAGWRDHRVSFLLAHSDEFKAWDGKDSHNMSQTEFAEFIEERLHDFAVPSGGKMLELALNFKAKTDAQFRSAMRQQDGTVDFEYTETVNAAAGAAGKMQIPEKFTIRVPVWSGLKQKQYELTALLRYRLNGGKLSFFFKLERAEKVVEQAFADTLEGVKKEVAGVPVIFGVA